MNRQANKQYIRELRNRLTRDTSKEMAPQTSEEKIRLFNKTFGENVIWQNIYSKWMNVLNVEDEKNILRQKNGRKISSKLCSEEGFSNKIKIIKENFLNLIYTHSKNKS